MVIQVKVSEYSGNFGYIFFHCGLTLYLIETLLNTFANRADPDQTAIVELPDLGLLCLLMEILLDMVLHYWT